MKMKAAIYKQYGPPEIVQLKEIEKPVPKNDEVLIKVYAATVNRTDCGFRSAEYFIVRFFSGIFKPKNQILGNEFAGKIDAIGAEVSNFKIGDKVFGYNDETFGAHAEYMVMQANKPIAIMPEGITFETAAAITEGAHYALCDLKSAKIKHRQKILINGATGGIGSAAVQLSKHFGATVTAVCATAHIEKVKALGADVVIDYQREDFTKINDEFDIVFDAVGKSSFGKCKPILKKFGVYMSTELGYGSQNIFLALITPFLGGKKVLFPLPTIDKKDLEFLKELITSKQYLPLIDISFPLDEIVEAYRYVETGQKIGNVVITIASVNE